VLQDRTEHAMVRHEAAEALGAIADESCIQLLQQYSHDKDPIVADSCIVALDMIAHDRSGTFEYADMGDAE
jgi:deoxyhypusine monooxygenase